VQQDAQTGGVGEHVEELRHDDDVLLDGQALAVTVLRGPGPGSWHDPRISEQLFG
jgi:hypothetical protein